MARVLLIEASPFDPATGAVVPVRIAGGGSRAYTHRGFTDWRAGLVTEPLFTTLLGFDEKGWTGGSLPQTGAVAIAPASDDTLDELAGLVWTDAAIELRSGDDAFAEPAWSLDLKGTVAGLTVKGGVLNLTISDFSGDLAKPVAPDSFAGNGGLEGGDDAVGRVKRRSWGRVWNVEGRLLDKANNIYEFGDPAHPLAAIDAVKDRGREGDLVVVDWAGTVAATFAALQAAEAPQGGAAIAPSIACAKWWTIPAGPLTADIRGESAGGYVETVAEIAARIIAAHSTITIDGLADAVAARPEPAGLHCDSASETAGQALDRLLLGASMIWAMQPEGTIALYPIGFDDPVETVAFDRVEREAAYPPVASVKLGYAKNQRKQTDGEISAAVLAGDVEGLGPLATADEVDWQTQVGGAGKPEDGATVGATVGSGDQPGNLQKPGGGTYTDGDIETSKGTSADTANVGGRPVGQVLGDIDTAKSDIQDLIATYGDTAAAADSAAAAAGYASTAQTASNNAAAAKADAEAARDAGQGYASTASNSASLAVSSANAAEAAANVLLPFDFQQDGAFWSSAYFGAPGRGGVNQAHWQFVTVAGVGRVAESQPTDPLARHDLASQGAVRLTPGHTYKVTARAQITQNSTINGGDRVGLYGQALDAAYALAATYSAVYDKAAADGWFDLAVVILADTVLAARPESVYLRPTLIHAGRTANPTDGKLQLAFLRIEDVTESTSAASSASAAANSLSAVTAIQTDVTQKASTVTEQTNTATTKAGEASASAAQAATSASDAQGYANTASTQSSNAANSATLAGQKADAASGSASTATTKASDAAQSASAAQASQVAASTSAASTLPSTFENGSEFFLGDGGGTFPSNVALYQSDAGPAYETTGTSYAVITTKNAMAVTSGRVYRLSAKVKNQAANSTAQRPWMRCAIYSASSSTRLIYMANTYGSGGSAWEIVSVDVTAEQIIAVNSTAAFIRPEIVLNYPSGAAAFGSVCRLQIEDVTESSKAASSAGAAATSANQADASNTAAGQHAAAAANSATAANTASGNAQTYAGQASTSETNAASSASSASASSGTAATYSGAAFDAAVQTMPSTFEQGGTFFFAGYRLDPATQRPANSGWTFPAVAGVGPIAQNVVNASATVSFDLSNYGLMKVVSGRVYRAKIIGRISALTGGPASCSLQAYLIGIQSDGVTYATSLAGSRTATVADGWVTVAGPTLSGDEILSWAGNPTNIRCLARCVIAPSAAATVTVQWQQILIEDVTESYNAAASASTAQSQASVATSQAAAAQSSATVAATVANASLNANPVFAQWTGSWPDPWGAPSLSAGASMTRVTGVNSPYALRGVSVAGGQCYLSQTSPAGTGLASMGPGYYVVEVDVHVDAGDLTGAGVIVDGLDASGATPQRLTIPLTGMLGSAGAVGKTYYLRQLVQLTNATIVKGRVYVMTSWTGFGTVTAKTLTWYRCAVRPATDQEIAAKQASADISSLTASVSQQAGAIADLQDKTATAYVETTASVPGAEATVQIVATTSDGSPASAINLAADAVTIGGQRTLEVVGGEVTVNGNLSATSGIALGTTGNVWPVALRPKDYLVSDGDVVAFGVDLGSIPQVDFSLLNLDPLNAGESYHLYADGLSSTGFTARLRIVVPGTPSNYDLTVDASGASGEPNRVISKGSNPDSSDGSYQITFTGQVWASSRIVKPQPLLVQQTSTTATYSVWVKKNNAWSKIATHTESSVSPDAADGGGTNFNNFTYTNTYQLGSGVQAIGVSLDTYTNSLGNGTYGAASLTDITHFKWTAPGTSMSERTATSHGQTSRVTVRPQ